MRSFIPRAATLLAAAVLFFTTTGSARAYTLEFMDKWGLSYFQTFGPVSSTPGGPAGATTTWNYITDGAGFSDAQTTLPFAPGSSSSLGTIRAAMDAQYGAGAFEAAVNKAFAAWASIANVQFVQVPDTGAPFAGTTAIDIRIGAYTFTGGSDVGGIGYGPPRDAVNFPDALAGDIAFSLAAIFRSPPGLMARRCRWTQCTNTPTASCSRTTSPLYSSRTVLLRWRIPTARSRCGRTSSSLWRSWELRRAGRAMAGPETYPAEPRPWLIFSASTMIASSNVKPLAMEIGQLPTLMP